MRIIDCEQGSPEWFAARVGRVTASRIADVMAKGRNGTPSATRAAYMGELIAGILTGKPVEGFQGNIDTQRGNEREPAARASYEVRRKVMVDTVGLVIHPDCDRLAASPDGLVGAEGLLEIKCPRPHVHLDYILGGEPPKAYIPQMAMQALCTGRRWVDFASYSPEMPEDMQLFVVRYVPTPDYLKEIATAALAFLDEVDEKLARIQRRREAA